MSRWSATKKLRMHIQDISFLVRTTWRVKRLTGKLPGKLLGKGFGMKVDIIKLIIPIRYYKLGKIPSKTFSKTFAKTVSR